MLEELKQKELREKENLRKLQACIRNGEDFSKCILDMLNTNEIAFYSLYVFEHNGYCLGPLPFDVSVILYTSEDNHCQFEIGIRGISLFSVNVSDATPFMEYVKKQVSLRPDTLEERVRYFCEYQS